jgi:ubiquinone/menaquinone biosynthesis C-methylase UbiE
MDALLQRKWDRASRTYDLVTWGDERRFGPAKRRLFASMTGRCLMVAAGTGNDFAYFPPGLQIVAIDVSPRMVDRAAVRAALYRGGLSVRLMDVQALEFDDATFDTTVTACTFCSVPDPVRGLRELYRCLTPGGQLLMFEHVRSRIGPIAILQDLMTPISRRFGPEMNRDTVGNVLRSGFELCREENVYLDVVKAIEARRPMRGPSLVDLGTER